LSSGGGGPGLRRKAVHGEVRGRGHSRTPPRTERRRGGENRCRKERLERKSYHPEKTYPGRRKKKSRSRRRKNTAVRKRVQEPLKKEKKRLDITLKSADTRKGYLAQEEGKAPSRLARKLRSGGRILRNQVGRGKLGRRGNDEKNVAKTASLQAFCRPDGKREGKGGVKAVGWAR